MYGGFIRRRLATGKGVNPYMQVVVLALVNSLLPANQISYHDYGCSTAVVVRQEEGLRLALIAFWEVITQEL